MPKPKTVSKRKVVRGRVPGVSVPATAKSAAHSRVAGWKHGGYAQVVSPLEARAAKTAEMFGAGAAEVLQANYDALVGGETSGTDELNVIGLTETELIRRKLVESIHEKGVMIEEPLITAEGVQLKDADGQALTRGRIHPGIEPLRWMGEHLGHTAADTQLSRKSRGEGKVNEAVVKRLERDALLRGISKDSLVPPPPLLTSAK